MKYLKIKSLGNLLLQNPLIWTLLFCPPVISAPVLLQTNQHSNNLHPSSSTYQTAQNKTNSLQSPQQNPFALTEVGDAEDWTLAQERRIGDEIAYEIFNDPSLIEDPILNEYVNDIGFQLLNTAYRQKVISAEMYERFAWTFFLSKDKTINAFALPGAYFGVHLGLINMTESKDELASVLAHEISHVTQRHISRNNTQQKKMAPAIVGAMILGAILSSRSEAGTQATIVGAQALGIQTQLNYSREMERESDRLGYQLLKAAGFDSQAFVDMFEKLQYANRLTDSGNFPYLRSHPLTTERIGDMKARDLNSKTLTSDHSSPLQASDQPTPLSVAHPSHPLGSLEHSLITARSKILSGQQQFSQGSKNEFQNPGFYQATLEKKSHLLMLAAVHAAEQKNFTEAEKHTAQLWQFLSLELSSSGTKTASSAKTQDLIKASRIVALFLADNAFKQLQLTACQKWLAQSEYLNTLIKTHTVDDPNLELMRSNIGKNKRPELLIKAQLAAKGIDTDTTLHHLKTWLGFFPNDALAWLYISKIYEMQNKQIAQLRALAEVEIARLNWEGARERFKAAQNWAEKNPNLSNQQRLDLAIVDARLNHLMQLLRERQIKK